MKTEIEIKKNEYYGLLDKIKDPQILNLYSETLIKVVNEKIQREKLNLQ